MKLKWYVSTGDKICAVETEPANMKEALKEVVEAMETLEKLMEIYNSKLPLTTPFEKWVRRQRIQIAGSSVTEIKIWWEVVP